ncbi:MOSC domain-containing protein [Pedobacter sp. HDW13]|uniref:MOSC domain-containing protein n=1 Tax=unclassified Pedobacter TaxID=2628915 RepID=UPI000F5B4AAB|nr:MULTISPECIES: MOSC N-terminal beta barrel domain-containing protein [unclassified Pedobacter]QIL38360.1 MOSC domain-containing protein [Pedobacter sp. HDW13]RQO73779.1 MOSC domain-containing protein [Pedobacter sp. KBW01]
MNKFSLSEIYVYPIKSLGGFRLKEAHLEDKGLKYDRRWMLVDEDGTFITQRKHFELALLQVSIADGKLTVAHKLTPELHISFGLDEDAGTAIPVSIWNDASTGLEVNAEVSEWFSAYLKFKVKLVKMPLAEKRFVDRDYASNDEIVSFADGYPCLMIGQAALNGLNEKLQEPVLMDRFRPNFVFTGGEPHQEDQFKTFYIGDILFSAVKPCARCVLITIDQQTGEKGQEPLRTLAGYRTLNKKIMFGQNLIPQALGIIRTGDEIRVVDWK